MRISWHCDDPDWEVIETQGDQPVVGQVVYFRKNIKQTAKYRVARSDRVVDLEERNIDLFLLPRDVMVDTPEEIFEAKVKVAVAEAETGKYYYGLNTKNLPELLLCLSADRVEVELEKII